jgi:hypothetical protein
VTDDESFGDLVSQFPMTSQDVRLLLQHATMLHSKVKPRGYGEKVYADGTMSAKSVRQLVAFRAALIDLDNAARMLENDTDPGDDDIPF